MTSFVFDIGEMPRKVARAIGHVRSELQKAFVTEKKATKLTQQAIATKRGVHRSVINRQLTGVDDLTYRSIVENALAMGYEPKFSLHRTELLAPGRNEPSHAVTQETTVAVPLRAGTLSPPLISVPTVRSIPVLATDTRAKPRKK